MKHLGGYNMATQGLLFDGVAETVTNKRAVTPIIPTEGVKYIGSKRQLLPFILSIISLLDAKTIFDGFSGTTRVSQALSRSKCRVISSDISAWSQVFGNCYLLNKHPKSYYQNYIKHLNSLRGVDGWFTQNYGGEPNGGSSVQKDGKKRIWQLHNTRKLDAIREEIDQVTQDEVERSVLLTSLILAMDKVDNTVGHHVSYLKQWAPRAYNTMYMQVPSLILSEEQHQVIKGDIFDVLPQAKADLAYFDPPYGSSNEKMPPSRVRYASYYHLWATVCLNDKPNLVGVARRREDTSDTIAGSVFEEFRRGASGRFLAIEAIERLIRETQAKYILLSYNNQGRATKNELIMTIENLGFNHEVLEINYKDNVMATMRWTHDWIHESRDKITEYLILLSRSEKLPSLT